jgi:two-component system, NarL family, sensor kinase
MSYLLHPPLLDESGLQSALRWYADGFAQRSGIEVKLEISDDISRLPGDLEIAIFRLVQESLTNILPPFSQHNGCQPGYARCREGRGGDC